MRLADDPQTVPQHKGTKATVNATVPSFKSSIVSNRHVEGKAPRLENHESCIDIPIVSQGRFRRGSKGPAAWSKHSDTNAASR